MSNTKPQLAPVVVCLILGAVIAFILPTSSTDKPTRSGVATNTAQTNQVPAPVPVKTNEFANYISSGGSNIHAHLLAATNPVERAVWEDIEKRFNQVDWQAVAKTLARATNTVQNTNP